jgi:hypothetical protein
MPENLTLDIRCSSYSIKKITPTIRLNGEAQRKIHHSCYREIIADCLRLLVGAPRANSTFPSHANLKEPGQVYRCLLGNPNRDQCQPLIVEREGNFYEIAGKRYSE